MASPPTSPPPPGGREQIPGKAHFVADFVGATSTTQDDEGDFDGGHYTISHRSTNTLLTLQLDGKHALTVKPGKLSMFPCCAWLLASELTIWFRGDGCNGYKPEPSWRISIFVQETACTCRDDCIYCSKSRRAPTCSYFARRYHGAATNGLRDVENR